MQVCDLASLCVFSPQVRAAAVVTHRVLVRGLSFELQVGLKAIELKNGVVLLDVLWLWWWCGTPLTYTGMVWHTSASGGFDKRSSMTVVLLGAISFTVGTCFSGDNVYIVWRHSCVHDHSMVDITFCSSG